MTDDEERRAALIRRLRDDRTRAIARMDQQAAELRDHVQSYMRPEWVDAYHRANADADIVDPPVTLSGEGFFGIHARYVRTIHDEAFQSYPDDEAVDPPVDLSGGTFTPGPDVPEKWRLVGRFSGDYVFINDNDGTLHEVAVYDFWTRR